MKTIFITISIRLLVSIKIHYIFLLSNHIHFYFIRSLRRSKRYSILFFLNQQTRNHKQYFEKNRISFMQKKNHSSNLLNQVITQGETTQILQFLTRQVKFDGASVPIKLYFQLNVSIFLCIFLSLP